MKNPNLLCDGKFVMITPISESIRDQYFCSYCPDYRLATNYVQRLDRRCRFSQHYVCDRCCVGWVEIADENNQQTI